MKSFNKFLFFNLTFLLTLLPTSTIAVEWPVYLEGTSAVRNVVFESFLRPS